MPERLKILMLEDEPADAELAAQALLKAGINFSSRRVDTRHAFIAALGEFRPDLILADYHLPAFDGLAALAIAVERLPEVPFLFVSGAMGEEFAIETLHRGAADYVLKNHLGKLAPAVTRALQEAAERNLRRRLAAIVESSEDAILGYSVTGQITTWNGGAVKMYGYSADEIVGKSVTLLSPSEGEQEVADLLVVVRTGKSVVHHETSRRHKDGRLIDVSLSLSPIRDASGAICGISTIARDITERKAAERTLQRLNRELRAISKCNLTLMRAEDEQSLLNDICHIVCDEAGYHMAWVGYAEEDEDKTLHPVAWAGTENDYLRQAGLTWADTERGRGPSGKAFRSGMTSGITDFATDPDAAPWRESALQRGFRSSIALPLKGEGAKPFGVLAIYAAEPNAFAPDEIRLLEELAGDLAFGIMVLRARTEHRKAEEQLRIAATAFETQEGIVITDADEMILRVNRAFSNITGYAPEDVVGNTPRLLQSGRHDPAFYSAMWERIQSEGSWQGEILNRRKSGEIYPEWLNITAVKNALGEVTHYVGAFVDITARKAAEQEIEHLAYFDLLTQLPNRRLLLDRLQHALAGCARTQRMGALLFIDLDNFKILNDTCGHEVGDQLLIKVANRLTTCARDGDTISRLGGDEFVVMLENLNENPQEAAAQAKAIGEMILTTLCRPYMLAGNIHHSTPSIGATLFGDKENSVDELLKQADIAMYQAKSAGRNTLRFFDPDMQAILAVRAELEATLRLGIQRHQFVLHFQPQVDSTRGIVGAEALLRWEHPELGMVPQAQFISLAEETGLILPIGQWVLEEACARLTAWAADPLTRNLQLAINVSAHQFRQEDFVDQVTLALEKTGAPAARLKLELTESLVLDDIEGTIKKMHALKKLGVGFSMDDFGTGYSSLSYLTRLPLDQLKIDQSFIHNLPDSSNDAVVVQTIITLAKSLGLAVIAEGLETEAQRQFLEQHGCPVFQGYLFSKPVALAEFEKLLAPH